MSSLFFNSSSFLFLYSLLFQHLLLDSSSLLLLPNFLLPLKFLSFCVLSLNFFCSLPLLFLNDSLSFLFSSSLFFPLLLQLSDFLFFSLPLLLSLSLLLLDSQLFNPSGLFFLPSSDLILLLNCSILFHICLHCHLGQRSYI